MTKYGQFYNRKQYLLFSNWTRFSWYVGPSVDKSRARLKSEKIRKWILKNPSSDLQTQTQTQTQTLCDIADCIVKTIKQSSLLYRTEFDFFYYPSMSKQSFLTTRLAPSIQKGRKLVIDFCQCCRCCLFFHQEEIQFLLSKHTTLQRFSATGCWIYLAVKYTLNSCG